MNHVSRDWKRELQNIINRNNDRHAVKHKCVSYKTMHERAIFYFGFFTELRNNEERCYKINPSRFGNRHVHFMVNRWVRRRLSQGTIQDYISHLRVLAAWLGKDGMIREAKFYVSDPELVTRTYAAQRDKSWSAQGVASGELITKVMQADKYVGAQLAMCLAFGFRVSEAIMFQPFLAVSDDGSRLTLLRGAKGGRRRDLPIDTEAKRTAVQLAREVAVAGAAHLGNPERLLEQNRNRFYTIMDKFGITRGQKNITAHGLRHQYANDRYEELTGSTSPVRGGQPIERNLDRTARLSMAGELGHSRANISTSYVGAVLRKPDTAAPEGDNDTAGSVAGDDAQSKEDSESDC